MWIETCNQAKYGVNYKINNSNCDNDIDRNIAQGHVRGWKGIGHYLNLDWIRWIKFGKIDERDRIELF